MNPKFERDAAYTGDGGGAADSEVDPRGMPVGESPEAAPSNADHKRGMVPKVISFCPCKLTYRSCMLSYFMSHLVLEENFCLKL